jgi:hypothetical protein
MQSSSKAERSAAYRESARSVAAALLGFTLQAASVLPQNPNAEAQPLGFMAFKERATASRKELYFISLAGEWFALETEESPSAIALARKTLLAEVTTEPETDEIAFNLQFLLENYSEAIFGLADELIRRKIMNGSECGKIIQSFRPRSGQKH